MMELLGTMPRKVRVLHVPQSQRATLRHIRLLLSAIFKRQEFEYSALLKLCSCVIHLLIPLNVQQMFSLDCVGWPLFPGFLQ